MRDSDRLPVRDVIPEDARERILRRASELDAMRGGVRVADLRAAAAEAGISRDAFDAALAEEHAPRTPSTATHHRRRAAVVAMAALVVAIMFWPSERPTSTAAGVPKGALVEQTFFLRCISPHDAMTAIRKNLQQPGIASMWATVGSNAVTLEASGADIERVRAALAKVDGAGGSCRR